MSSELEEVKIMMARLEAKFDMAMMLINDQKKQIEDLDVRISTAETKMNYAAGIAAILTAVLFSTWDWFFKRGIGG